VRTSSEGYLLDTNAVSEARKSSPNRGYAEWLSARKIDETFVSAPTVGELFQGIASAKTGAARDGILHWATALLEEFEHRILPFDANAAEAWGEANGKARRSGRSLPIIDSQIAAIAFVNDLAIVTRNVRDFDIPEFEGLKVISPWN
jgi:predicted nucleic acid-binding protein